MPPLPVEKLAALAPIATLVRLSFAMKIDITKPDAIRKMAEKLKQVSKLPSQTSEAATASIPGMMSNLSAVQTHHNIATFYKIDTASLTPDEFISKVGVPLQPAVEFSKKAIPPLSPEQAANAQSWASSSQYLPALKLMQNFDVSKLDLAPLSDIPPIPDFGVLASVLALNDAAQDAAKKTGAKDFPKTRLIA